MTRDEIIKMAREAHAPDPMVFLSAYERLTATAYAAGAAAERESIMDEWWARVQSDLENGVKLLNERAAEKWHKEYPAIAGFDAAIRARGTP